VSSTTPSESSDPGKFIWSGSDIELVGSPTSEGDTINDPGVMPMCEVCAHMTGPFTCAAFPSGIPAAIQGKERVDHRLPFKGDAGIRFKKDRRNDRKEVARILKQYSV
jgi:hypothetical protein